MHVAHDSAALRNQLCYDSTCMLQWTWTLLCSLTSAQRFWQLLRPFKPWNRWRGRLAAWPQVLPPHAYQVLLLSNRHLTCSRSSSVKQTHIEAHRALSLAPAGQASWLSPLTHQSNTDDSHRPLCSRSGCHGWAATWTAGEDVSAVHTRLSSEQGMRRVRFQFRHAVVLNLLHKRGYSRVCVLPSSVLSERETSQPWMTARLDRSGSSWLSV